MKKIILYFFCLFITMSAFGLKLPTGENVRATDVVLEDGAIVSVNLVTKADIMTPIGKITAAQDSTVTFYKSGALKSIKPEREYDYDLNKNKTTITLNGQNLTTERDIYFYESGALEKVYLYYKTPFEFSIEGSIAKLCQEITFFDSGSASEFKVYKGYLESPIEIERDGETLLITNDRDETEHIYLYGDGSVRLAKLEKEAVIKTAIGDLFAAEGRLSFWENKKIKSFINSDTVIENIAGILANIPGGKEITFYKSGKLRTFHVAPNTEFTVGEYSYTTIDVKYSPYGYKPFLISETEEILETPYVMSKNEAFKHNEFCIMSFDSKGNPRIIWARFKYAMYKNEKGSFDYYEFNNESYDSNNYYISKNGAYYGSNRYCLKEGHSGSWVWMVYFNQQGEPSSYSIRYADGLYTSKRDTEKIPFVKKKD